MADAKRLRITLVRSSIGFKKNQKVLVRTLGLCHMHDTRIVYDTPTVRGVINKVIHLLDVQEVTE